MDKKQNPKSISHKKSKKSWDEDIPAPSLPFSSASCIIALLAALCFYNSLHGNFVFDDSEAIINNNDVKPEAPWINMFYNDFWGTRLTHPSSHKSYRPLTVFSFRLNYKISGLNPFSFHLCNLVLHCAVCVISLQVFYVIFGSSAHKASLLSSLLFATHPIHTEAVSGIVGRADLLCALFVFIALLSYTKAVTEDSLHMVYVQSFNYRRNRSRDQYLAAVAVSTAVAMLCKEVGITALGLCSAYDILVAHSGAVGKHVLCCFLHKNDTQSKQKQLPEGILLSVVRRQIFLAVVGLLLLTIRWVIMGSTVPKFMTVDNPASFLDSFIFRSLNYQYVYGLNCLLLLLPIWLCFDWSMGCIPVINTFSDPRLFVVPIVWIGLGVLTAKGILASGRSSRCILISLALGIIPFLPATNLFFRVGFVIAERVLYIPVAGLCILVVTGLRELSASGMFKKSILQVFYIFIIAIYVLRCQQRSKDWLTESSLFRSGLSVCPLNAKVHYNMGKVAADSGNVSEAIMRYNEALRLNTDYDQAMNNLANILKDSGDLDEALHLLKKATSLREDFAAAWMNLGIVQASLNFHNDSEISYLQALSHRSVYPDCLYNLGNLYLEIGDHTKALSTWTNATNLKPTLAVAWTNILILLDSEGQYNDAVDVAHKALKHLPTEASLHFNLANTLGKLGKFELSEKHFRQATTIDPLNVNYWANLGVLYHRWKKYDLAEETYKHALKLSPNMKSAQDNLNMLQKTKRKNR